MRLPVVTSRWPVSVKWISRSNLNFGPLYFFGGMIRVADRIKRISAVLSMIKGSVPARAQKGMSVALSNH